MWWCGTITFGVCAWRGHAHTPVRNIYHVRLCLFLCYSLLRTDANMHWNWRSSFPCITCKMSTLVKWKWYLVIFCGVYLENDVDLILCIFEGPTEIGVILIPAPIFPYNRFIKWWKNMFVNTFKQMEMFNVPFLTHKNLSLFFTESHTFAAGTCISFSTY